MRGHSDIVNKLIDRGAQVDAVNFVSFTSLLGIKDPDLLLIWNWFDIQFLFIKWFFLNCT